MCEGYDVRAAPDGHTALALAAAHRPDPILPDDAMPDGGGPAFAARCRRLSPPRTPIVLMTASHEAPRPNGSSRRRGAYRLRSQELWRSARERARLTAPAAGEIIATMMDAARVGTVGEASTHTFTIPRRRRRLVRWVAVVTTTCLLAGAVGSWSGSAAAATTWHVSPAGADSPTCGTAQSPCRTIQYTIGRTAAGDTVEIAAGTYAEHLRIGHNLALVGAGTSDTIVDGGGSGTVAMVTAAATARLANMTLQNGFTFLYGGGINNKGRLTLVRALVTRNRAVQLDLPPGQGGGIYNAGSVTLIQSTVSENQATEAGGVYNVGVLRVQDSTLANNRTDSYGGAVESFGPFTLVNSTVVGNVAIYGGGVYNVGTLALLNSTVARNDSTRGGGIFADSLGSVTFKNSIVAGNRASYSDPDCLSNHNVASQDYNLVGNTAGCAFALGPHDIAGVPAGLGPLRANGGPTATLALLPGSPAIDSGGTSGNGCPATDQRGIARPQGPACDMGAYEAAVPG